ncbi:MAG: ATP-dependent helicase, partial [Bacilli bacterium]|nr:ATP-dependent helicase [Bacilli bacterium]
MGNVNALFDDIDHFIKKNPEASFADYLTNVSLLSAQDDINGGNYVSLMTIHVAKGLEFDHVFVICMNDGQFPSERSRMDEGRD